ncbi:MAG: hypothetical protein K0R54_4308, partial [Clostridiaceae bacterium]|nr:hypothetical protein [Clostridiaceae bacterium]
MQKNMTTFELIKSFKCSHINVSHTFLAGVVGFEPTANGFGDHYSTVEPYPYILFIID